MKNKRFKFILLIIVFLLLIPLITIQFTDKVNWIPIEFVGVGALLLSAGLIFDLVIRKVKNTKYRIAISLTVLILLFLFWAELAVGIFGTPLSGN